MSWHSEGVEFAIPVDRLIHVYSRDHEELLYSLKDEVISAVSNCSNCSRYWPLCFRGDTVKCWEITGWVRESI